MTEETTIETNELDVLKSRADKMGIKYHPSIGLETLKEKVNSALQPQEETNVSTEDTKETPNQRRVRLKKEANKLIRIRLSCHNPNKREWEGEIITVANSLVGTIKKFVPFDAEDGWHVPQFIYNVLKARKYQAFKTTRDERGNTRRVGYLANEFSIEVLPPLTEKELKELARKQAMVNGVE